MVTYFHRNRVAVSLVEKSRFPGLFLSRIISERKLNVYSALAAAGENLPEAQVLGSQWHLRPRFALEGTLRTWKRAGATVDIYINDRLLTTSALAAVGSGGGDKRTKTFRCGLIDVAGYLGDGDSLRVVIGNREVTSRDANVADLWSGRPSLVEVLFLQLESGKVLNKYGKLQDERVPGGAWFEQVTGLFEQVRAELKAQFDIDLFIFYGTMLRAVRDGGLSRTTNDFDAVYFSRSRKRKIIRAEFMAVCRFLLDRGYRLYIKRTHVQVWVPGVGKFDIFYAWFDREGVMAVSYGTHGPDFVYTPGCVDPDTVELWGKSLAIPAAGQEMLEALYGPGWATPNPGFSHKATTRKVARRFILRPVELEELRLYQSAKR